MPSAVDEHWFEKLKKATSFDFLECLDGNKEERQKQKSLFFSGKIRNPKFTYPYIAVSDLLKSQKALLLLLKELESEPNEMVQRIYADRINAELKKISLLYAVYKGDDSAFRACSEQLYGLPDASIFWSLVAEIRGKVFPFSQEKVASELLALLPVPPKESSPTPIPDSASFYQVQSALQEQLLPLTSLVTESELSKNFNSQEIKHVFDLGLEALGAHEWQVIITRTSKSSINVLPDKKTIFIPETREMEGSALRELLAHEIGCHVQRGLNGENSGLLLLSVGFPGYESAEEGFATLSQQILDKTFVEYSGGERYLAIGLTLGLDGKYRDFREVFTVLEKYYEFIRTSSSDLPPKSSSEASDLAWNATCRIFRGTTGQGKGACLTKDIIYRNGNISAWKYLSSKSSNLWLYLLGKADPTKDRDRDILFALQNRIFSS